MTQEEFQTAVYAKKTVIEEIRMSAHELHDSVNQFYDKTHHYGYHLDMVARLVDRYGYMVCRQEQDVLAIYFGAYYHDSIEDARVSYNDVMKTARQWLDDEQAFMGTEIVYALTNDKGRNRAERAGEKYYAGIRQTPYAPFVKLADRLANITYSTEHSRNPMNTRMRTVYREELPHFLAAIDAHCSDPRMALPKAMVEEIYMKLG